jgi:hypothetical protein
MARLPVPVAAFAIVIALAGCGGEDESADEFREGYNRVIAPVAEVSAELERSGAADQSNREIAADFERLADTWDMARTKLAALTPPEDARDEFDGLLSALEAGVEDLRSAARAAKAANPDRFADAREALDESGDEIVDAENALKNEVDR